MLYPILPISVCYPRGVHRQPNMMGVSTSQTLDMRLSTNQTSDGGSAPTKRQMVRLEPSKFLMAGTVSNRISGGGVSNSQTPDGWFRTNQTFNGGQYQPNIKWMSTPNTLIIARSRPTGDQHSPNSQWWVRINLISNSWFGCHHQPKSWWVVQHQPKFQWGQHEPNFWQRFCTYQIFDGASTSIKFLTGGSAKFGILNSQLSMFCHYLGTQAKQAKQYQSLPEYSC